MIDNYQLPIFLAQKGIIQFSTTRQLPTQTELFKKFPLENYVISKQVHDNKIFIAENIQGAKKLQGYDSFLTAQKEVALIIKTADCTPVFLYDPARKVIGAVHAGRKSTILKITELTVKKMIGTFFCSPENILAGLGPAICKDCYQIDPIKNIHFDLWTENLTQLLHSGLSRKNIEISDLCPSCNANDQFFSYRKDKTKLRTYNIIMLKDQ
jgi:copper oxidase (laccase) domain-containing protein